MTEQDFLMKVLPTWPQDLLLFRWSMHNDLVAVRWMTPEGFEVRVDYAIKPNVELLHDGGFSYHGNLDVTVSNLCGSYIDLGVQLALHWRYEDVVKLVKQAVDSIVDGVAVQGSIVKKRNLAR